MIGVNYQMADLLQVECKGIEGATDKRCKMDQQHCRHGHNKNEQLFIKVLKISRRACI